MCLSVSISEFSIIELDFYQIYSKLKSLALASRSHVHEYDPVIDFDEAQDAAQLTGNGLVLNGVQSNGFGITPVHPDAFDFATLQSNGLPNDLSLATADQLATFASCMEPPPVLLNGIGDGNGQ